MSHLPPDNNKASPKEALLDMTRRMLDAGADLNQAGENDRTLLMLAVLMKNEELVRLLIDRGARLNEKDAQGNTALMHAISKDYAQIARLLIEAGAGVSGKNKMEETPLKLAILNNKTELARALIEAGADINENDKWDRTPLIYAALWGRADIVQMLLDKGGFDKKDAQMQTALFVTVKPEVVKLLIAHGALAKDAHSAFIKACSAGYKEIARLLLDNGANPSQADTAGKPVLHMALDGHHMAIAEMLVAKGAALNAKDRAGGHTALVYAAAHGRIGVVQWLLDKGAAIDEVNSYGVTPLLSAARNGQDKCIRLLIDRGADMDRVSNGRTVFDMAEQSQRPETLQLLREIAADKKAQAEHLAQEERVRAAHAEALGKQQKLNRAGKRLRFGP